MNQEQARYYFDYCPETGVLTNRVKRPPYAHVGAVAGICRSDGYLMIWVRPHRVLAHRLIWIWNFGAIPDGMQIDHIDNDRTNNRLSNLRLALPIQNHVNSLIRSDNTSGVKGVSYWKNSKGVWRWRSRVRLNGKEYCSYHDEKDQAISACNRRRAIVHGEFANRGVEE